ncbi:copper amine oxidase N-terminal domain-containing protein [Paenibacillus odorifer]|uniref:Copper amine oxidase n=1 Tax=Paenibacillus odorifer TaxID=189426 RepID=A0AAD0P337_9BACL|nr:copper amine oxidase N-terminal domain-containing protein [Paenibacillus odorifer]AWV32715.1 copper amine oxidase [Paenibacillus odorifer]
MRNFKFNSLSAIIRSKKARRGMTIVICVFASLVLLITTAGAAGTAAKAVNVIIDGIKYPLTKGHPYSENGTTMIPFRMISGKFGTQANWNAANQTLTLQQKENKIVLTVGSSFAKVNGQPVALGAMVVQKDGMTMIPLTVVSNLLSAEVEVDEFSQSVHIHTPGKDLGELDYFGRKIRTTNLPKNYKDYPYILEDIPNEMYEMRHTINYSAGDAETGAQVFSKKELTSEDMAKIIKRMKIGFDLRLNVDYKTINPASYAKESFKYENQSSSIREKEIEEYAEWVKKNKIQIEGAIDPESSVLYYPGTGDYRVRSMFRFRINSFTEYKDLFNDVYFKLAEFRLHEKLKKGVWYEGYADLSISTNYYNPIVGEHFNIDALSSLFENTTLHEVK